MCKLMARADLKWVSEPQGKKEVKNLGSGIVEARKSQFITQSWQRAFFLSFFLFWGYFVLLCFARCLSSPAIPLSSVFLKYILYIFGLLYHLFYIISLGCAGSSLLYRLSLVAVHGLFILVAHLVVTSGLQVDSWTQYLWFRGIDVPWPVRWRTRWAVPWQVRSSLTKNGSSVPCIGRWILNHWTARSIAGKELWMLACKLFPGTIWFPFSFHFWRGPVCKWLLQGTHLLASCKCVEGSFLYKGKIPWNNLVESKPSCPWLECCGSRIPNVCHTHTHTHTHTWSNFLLFLSRINT